jgi:asparagine synthase (glutamine-hydrolysing)
MCGICGTAGFADRTLLQQMSSVIAHRGPDDEGFYVSPRGAAALGSRRLSIVDLSSAGHMPMQNEQGNLWITYNGEVYNFPALRKELQESGYRFKSGTDTETILKLFESRGVASFSQLNGMFAFGIWNEASQELWLVRDRLGVKPLYYTRVQNQLLFGSEIKSLLLDPRVPREIDEEALNYYLAHLWVPGPKTIFKGIYKLPAGHYLHWSKGDIRIQKYWELKWSENKGASPGELTQQLRSILRASVARHLIADVPVGLYLSGGLDSTALLALMTEIQKAPIDTYTIAFRSDDRRFEQGEKDDEFYAEAAARHFGARHHSIRIEPDIINLLPRVIWHLDEPVADPASINTLLIAEQARKDVKVLLSGQGADEVFGGYPVYLVDRLANSISKLPPLVKNGFVKPALKYLPTIASHSPIAQGLSRAVQRYSAVLGNAIDLAREDRFLSVRSYYGRDRLRSMYSDELRSTFAAFDSNRQHKHYFDEVHYTNFLNQMLHVDLKTFLPELNLTYGDKLSMAASVELRVPFLDYELIEFMAKVEERYKISGLTTKVLLRRAVADVVPQTILKRRKAGFKAPIGNWLRKDLKEMVGDYLSPASIRHRGLFDPSAVQALIERNATGVEDNTYRIWSLLTLEIWLRTFMDRPVETRQQHCEAR